jgi:Ca2+-transporting ATPase
MAVICIIIFLMVWGVCTIKHRTFLNSLLKGLTLGMSILPENSCRFTTFMAGSYRLMKVSSLKNKTVENAW